MHLGLAEHAVVHGDLVQETVEIAAADHQRPDVGGAGEDAGECLRALADAVEEQREFDLGGGRLPVGGDEVVEGICGRGRREAEAFPSVGELRTDPREIKVIETDIHTGGREVDEVVQERGFVEVRLVDQVRAGGAVVAGEVPELETQLIGKGQGIGVRHLEIGRVREGESPIHFSRRVLQTIESHRVVGANDVVRAVLTVPPAHHALG